MDRFYLQNTALYGKLVDSLDVTKPAAHFSRHKAVPSKEETDSTVIEECNPDMIIGARIRPMLDDDIAAGFPCAAYPRARGPDGVQIVDLHDLYNYPYGRPILKV